MVVLHCSTYDERNRSTMLSLRVQYMVTFDCNLETFFGICFDLRVFLAIKILLSLHMHISDIDAII